MSRPIAFNLQRGIVGAIHATPRGIDRINFGLVSHLLNCWPAECFGVLPTAWGVRFVSAARVRKGRDRLAALWREAEHGSPDPAYARLLALLDGGGRSGMLPRQRHPVTAGGISRMLRLLLESGLELGEPVTRLPRGTIYLDAGHRGLTQPRLLTWLDRRHDIHPVFFLYDAIPLQMPHLETRQTVRAHARVMAATACYARAVLVPTVAAGEAIARELARRGRHDLPIHALSLPVDSTFLQGGLRDSRLGRHRYFVICGTIEPRKNHDLLAAVWERLAAKLGDRTPRLVVGGSPGHASRPIIRRLTQTPSLAPFVIMAPGLASSALARLMANARAVLMPSRAEGFGLPPVEALALGTPALLSDIDAHREAAGAQGIYIDADDVAGWTRAIEAMSHDSPDYVAWKRHLAGFTPLDWPRYMAPVIDVLNRLH